MIACYFHAAAIRNGHTSNGTQRWKCKRCKSNFTFGKITVEERQAVIKNHNIAVRRRIRNKVLDRRPDLLDRRLEEIIRRRGF